MELIVFVSIFSNWNIDPLGVVCFIGIIVLYNRLFLLLSTLIFWKWIPSLVIHSLGIVDFGGLNDSGFIIFIRTSYISKLVHKSKGLLEGLMTQLFHNSWLCGSRACWEDLGQRPSWTGWTWGGTPWVGLTRTEYISKFSFDGGRGCWLILFLVLLSRNFVLMSGVWTSVYWRWSSCLMTSRLMLSSFLIINLVQDDSHTTSWMKVDQNLFSSVLDIVSMTHSPRWTSDEDRTDV